MVVFHVDFEKKNSWISYDDWYGLFLSENVSVYGHNVTKTAPETFISCRWHKI